MLPLNFHQTFIPERRFIAEILDYAAMGKQGSYQEISSDTGIPMGKSSGKVPVILAYAAGMGLIEVFTKKGAVKKPILTPFGKTIYAKDKYLSESVVQWLVHMNMCRNDIGARTWHAVFAQGRNIIGSIFLREQLEEYLVEKFGIGKRRIGPLISTYIQDASLQRANVLSVKGNKIIRNKAPILESYSVPYSAYILSLLDAYFKGQSQVTVSDFNQETNWFEICLWSQPDIELIFNYIEQKGYISFDRQMRPWIIEKKAKAGEVWVHIWDKMA